MHGTRYRQLTIAKLIRSQDVISQAHLVELLESEYNIKSTQTVISRDLKVMGVARQIVDGKRVYRMPEQDTEKEILKLGVKDIQYNESLIVITTQPALAPYVGDAIDATDLDILGCLAGENTIFVTPTTVTQIKKVYLALCEALHFQPEKS